MYIDGRVRHGSLDGVGVAWSHLPAVALDLRWEALQREAV